MTKLTKKLGVMGEITGEGGCRQGSQGWAIREADKEPGEGVAGRGHSQCQEFSTDASLVLPELSQGTRG